MLHGWISTHKVFSKSLSAIGNASRCITYDHRGHGKSMKAAKEPITMDMLASDLNELITGLDLHDLTLLGWSMGAGAILNYVSRYGCGALRQIVLCDMSPRQMNDEDWTLGLFQGQLTKEFAENEAGKDFYDFYKSFAVGALPKPSAMRRPPFLLPALCRRLIIDVLWDKSMCLSTTSMPYQGPYSHRSWQIGTETISRRRSNPWGSQTVRTC